MLPLHWTRGRSQGRGQTFEGDQRLEQNNHGGPAWPHGPDYQRQNLQPGLQDGAVRCPEAGGRAHGRKGLCLRNNRMEYKNAY